MTNKVMIEKRDGTTLEQFDAAKIAKAIMLCDSHFSELKAQEISRRIRLEITGLSKDIISTSTIHDMVEQELMGIKPETAKTYILNRHKKDEQAKTAKLSRLPELENIISTAVKDYVEDKEEQNRIVALLTAEAITNTYVGITIDEVYDLAILSAKGLMEEDPAYSYIAANILRAKNALEVVNKVNKTGINWVSGYFEYCREHELLDDRLCDIFGTSDCDFFGAYNPIEIGGFKNGALKLNYLGMQTLYDRYLLRHEGVTIETPEVMFMRVAMGLAINEQYPHIAAAKFFKAMMLKQFMPSTPTLFNSGTKHPQLSSCYLSTIKDDLKSIYLSLTDNALLSKFAGGLGNDWTNVRALGSQIKGTNGTSQGVVPFLKVANDTAVAVNQGGKRKGAVCAYLETWHLDIEEFLELRKNTGDDRRRTHDMNTANWIPDLFMHRVDDDQDWTLFSPEEVPHLHDLYGFAFDKAYHECEERAKNGEIKNFKTIRAKDLWRKMLTMLYETGHPWITFKDTCNIGSPQKHAGVVHSSNLCTEITLNTSAGEIAVCNLGSLNLMEHLKVRYNEIEIDREKLAETITVAVRMLDNVIDVNFYPVTEAKNSNLEHRPIGLGLMGWAGVLQKMRIPYDSEDATEIAGYLMEFISKEAIKASSKLGVERGNYPSFDGSDWSKGVLPIDNFHESMGHRGIAACAPNSDNWDDIREKVRKNMRNSNVIAIAPTATIANICGVTPSTEPPYQLLYTKSNLSGEFTFLDENLVEALKKKGLWGKETVDFLKRNDGSIQDFDDISEEMADVFKTAFEVNRYAVIFQAAARQPFIDQSQSTNIYFDGTNAKDLSDMYMTAWREGLKTTYYLRTLGATRVEKSTIEANNLKAVQCSIDDEDCEACQ